MTAPTTEQDTLTPAQQALRALSRALFVRVHAITQTGDDDDTAQIRLYVDLPDNRGPDTIRIGSVANWWTYPTVRRKIATRTGLVPQPLKPQEWMDLIEAIYDTKALTREDDEELSTTGRLAAILPAYILETGSTNRNEACSAGRPYHDEDRALIYVTSEDLALWLGRAKNWRIDAPDVRHALHDLAWTPSVALNYTVLDEAKGRSVRRKARYHEAHAADWLDTEEADA